MLDARTATLLRTALTGADFTPDAVLALIGQDSHRALLRNETVPARRATAGGSPLETLVRLFSLQLEVPLEQAERALPGLVDPLAAAGVLERSVAQVRARVDVRPYADEDRDWWVVCDLTPGLDGGGRRVGADHVLGISEASSSLAQLTLRHEVDGALDLGTGCGVQSLHLTRHARRVVGTDVNPRALSMARATALLNDVDYEVRDGSLLEPVRGETFDLVVTNPPFVVSPATGERLVYRDSGLPGDEVVRRIVTAGPAHLNPGGWLQVLANWVHRRGEPWEERVGGWIEPTGCDAWVLQREEADLATYVEMWLTDAGLHGTPEYVRRYDTWLSWFDEQQIESIGFGWLCLRAAGRDAPVLRLEEWPYELEQPLGPHVAAWAARVDLLAATAPDADGDPLLARRLVQAPDLLQEQVGEAGAEDPRHVLLRLQRGVRRAREVDTVEAALVGSCEGDLTVGELLRAVAVWLDDGRSGDDLAAAYLPAVRELVAEGYLA